MNDYTAHVQHGLRAINPEWQCRIVPPTAEEIAAIERHQRARKRRELWDCFVFAVCVTVLLRGL